MKQFVYSTPSAFSAKNSVPSPEQSDPTRISRTSVSTCADMWSGLGFALCNIFYFLSETRTEAAHSSKHRTGRFVSREVDHIIPYHLSGLHTGNLHALLCALCHARRTRLQIAETNQHESDSEDDGLN